MCVGTKRSGYVQFLAATCWFQKCLFCLIQKRKRDFFSPVLRSPKLYYERCETLIFHLKLLKSLVLCIPENAMAGSDEINASESKKVVPLNTWILISNFKLAYNMLRRPDGTFNRDLAEFLERKVAANTIPVDGVYSFDVVDRATSLLNRVYRPAPEKESDWGKVELEKPLSTTEVVPVIIFFHGGSFTHSSANSAIYDQFCRRLVKICGAVVVSVNYRRPWLQSGEDGKVHVFLAGDSSGGNIAHHVAVRAAESDVEVLGNILLHPMFGGQKRTESEMKLDGKYFVTVQDRDWYWRAYLPEGEDRDHPACNIFGPRGRALEGLKKFPKSLVVVAGFDVSQDWQLAYVQGLRESGQEVKLLFLEQATIGFYFLPNNNHFICLMEEITNFIHPLS
nr:gibberellin receptor GID1B-like isoform X1 [Ipomoea trifida]